jgi:hypothetical protein
LGFLGLSQKQVTKNIKVYKRRRRSVDPEQGLLRKLSRQAEEEEERWYKQEVDSNSDALS